MHYYRFNIPDWTLHTAHLSPEEEGVYFRLVNFYYDTEQPIPEKTQSVIRRLRLGCHEETVAQMLSEFFTLEGGEWHHKRCDFEIKAYHAKAEQNRLNGRRGGRPSKSKTQKKPKKTQSVISGNPNITLTNNHKPITNNHKDRGASAPARKKFKPPTKTQVIEYAGERDCHDFDADRFLDYYAAQGWKLANGRPMADWQASVRTWISRESTSDGRTGQGVTKHSQPTVADKLRGKLASM